MSEPNKVKSLRTVDNASAYAIVNAAYKQAVGAAAIDTITLDDFCDGGVAFASLTMSRDKFLKALIDQTVNFYTQEGYEDNYEDPYYVESRRFANVVQMIHASVGEVTEAHNMKDFAPTTSQGVTTYKTVGTYEVRPPQVDTSYYTKSISWELQVSITETEFEDAFKSGEELRGFVDYIFVVTQNKLLAHRKQLNALNRNAYIAEKILYAASQGATGIHKVNLLTEYNKQRSKQIATVAAFRADPDAMRFASAQLPLYAKYMKEQSAVFNTKGYDNQFIPSNRLVTEINSAFESDLNEVAYSTTYHDELIRISDYVSTPAWQGFGVQGQNTVPADFDQVTAIDVSVSSGDVKQSGIVALMVDKYAIMHTIRSERVSTVWMDPEALYLNFYQHRDQYMVNLGQNGVVFTIEAPQA